MRIYINEIYINEIEKNKLTKYKRIYKCTCHSTNIFHGLPIIQIEKFKVVYANKSYIYYKCPGRDELEVCKIDFTEKEELLNYKNQIKELYTFSDYSFSYDKACYFFTDEPLDEIKEYIKELNSKLKEIIPQMKKESLIKKLESEKEKYERTNFILECLKENNSKENYSACKHSSINGTCKVESCLFAGTPTCLRYQQKHNLV